VFWITFDNKQWNNMVGIGKKSSIISGTFHRGRIEV